MAIGAQPWDIGNQVRPQMPFRAGLGRRWQHLRAAMSRAVWRGKLRGVVASERLGSAAPLHFLVKVRQNRE